MKGRRWTSVVVVVLMLVGVGSIWTLIKNRDAARTLPDARESFVLALQESGIQVEKTAGTHAYVAFGVAQDAELGIWTNQGFMDVIFYPTDIEDRFTVTKVGDYSWKLGGLGQPVDWNSNKLWYFTARRNTVILTDSAELFKALGNLGKIQ